MIRLRKMKGISQEMLAESSRLSLRTVQRIEKGSTSPRLYTIKAIAGALGVPVAELSAMPDADTGNLAKIRLINLSALLVLAFPLGNLVFPAALAYRYKALPAVRTAAKKVIGFQVAWTLLSLVSLPLVYLAGYLWTGSLVSGRVPNFVLGYVALLLVNVILTLRTAVQLAREQADIYAFLPEFL